MKSPSVWQSTDAPPLMPDHEGAATSRAWDLVVVGGGIVGLLCALRARDHGMSVCVLEAREVGAGTTSHSTVKITSGHGAVAAEIARMHGVEVAIAYQRANSAGFADLATLVSQLPEDVGWTPSPHVVHGRAPSVQALIRESVVVAERAGAPVTECPTPSWSRGPAWMWEESALVQPLSLARALGRRLQERGVPIVEKALVNHIDNGDSSPRVHIEGVGDVRCGDVLVATHSPAVDPDLVAARMAVYRHAAIAVPVAHAIVPTSFEPGGMSTRAVVLPDGRPGAVVVGPSHRVGQMPAEEWGTLQAWAVSALRAGPKAYAWAAQDLRSPDLLPFVGRSRRAAHVLLATGFNAWGFTNAAAAAASLPLFLGGTAPAAELPEGWNADRFGIKGQRNLAETAWWVASAEAADHVQSVLRRGPARRGEGVVEGGPLTPTAECTTSDGERHRVSARCTHMGCLVRWNAGEESWDCPCHGSRFAPDGSVLEGPATRPLQAR